MRGSERERERERDVERTESQQKDASNAPELWSSLVHKIMYLIKPIKMHLKY